MGMNQIGRPSLQQRILQQYQKGGAAQPDGKTAPAARPMSTRPEPQGDRVEISREALKFESLEEALRAGQRAAADVPDVRADRIAQARERLATGQYDAPEVRRELAARLGHVIKTLEDLTG